MRVGTTLVRSSVRTRIGGPSVAPLARYNHDTSRASESSTTHFGYRTVPTSSKESLGTRVLHNFSPTSPFLIHRIVRNVFSSVAGSYDLMNDAMSMGVHRLWKDEFVSLLNPGSNGPIKCLDVAGGTGDISLRILDYAREKYADRETQVTVSDINPDMLNEGRRRFKMTMYHNSQHLALKML